MIFWRYIYFFFNNKVSDVDQFFSKLTVYAESFFFVCYLLRALTPPYKKKNNNSWLRQFKYVYKD